MAFARGLPLRAKEPFGLEHFLLRKEEKNEPYSQGIRPRSQAIRGVSLRDMVGYFCSGVGDLRVAWNCGAHTVDHNDPRRGHMWDKSQPPQIRSQ